MRRGGDLLSIYVIRALADPAVRFLLLQVFVDREQPQRFSRLLCFIHRAGFKRHRNRIRFIGARIIKAPIYHDRDGNQMSLALSGQHQQGGRAGPFAHSVLTRELRPRRACQQEQSHADDEPPAAAV